MGRSEILTWEEAYELINKIEEFPRVVAAEYLRDTLPKFPLPVDHNCFNTCLTLALSLQAFDIVQMLVERCNVPPFLAQADQDTDLQQVTFRTVCQSLVQSQKLSVELLAAVLKLQDGEKLDVVLELLASRIKPVLKQTLKKHPEILSSFGEMREGDLFTLPSSSSDFSREDLSIRGYSSQVLPQRFFWDAYSFKADLLALFLLLGFNSAANQLLGRGVSLLDAYNHMMYPDLLSQSKFSSSFSCCFKAKRLEYKLLLEILFAEDFWIFALLEMLESWSNHSGTKSRFQKSLAAIVCRFGNLLNPQAQSKALAMALSWRDFAVWETLAAKGSNLLEACDILVFVLINKAPKKSKSKLCVQLCHTRLVARDQSTRLVWDSIRKQDPFWLEVLLESLGEQAFGDALTAIAETNFLENLIPSIEKSFINKLLALALFLKNFVLCKLLLAKSRLSINLADACIELVAILKKRNGERAFKHFYSSSFEQQGFVSRFVIDAIRSKNKITLQLVAELVDRETLADHLEEDFYEEAFSCSQSCSSKTLALAFLLYPSDFSSKVFACVNLTSDYHSVTRVNIMATCQQYKTVLQSRKNSLPSRQFFRDFYDTLLKKEFSDPRLVTDAMFFAESEWLRYVLETVGKKNLELVSKKEIESLFPAELFYSNARVLRSVLIVAAVLQQFGAFKASLEKARSEAVNLAEVFQTAVCILQGWGQRGSQASMFRFLCEFFFEETKWSERIVVDAVKSDFSCLQLMLTSLTSTEVSTVLENAFNEPLLENPYSEERVENFLVATFVVRNFSLCKSVVLKTGVGVINACSFAADIIVRVLGDKKDAEAIFIALYRKYFEQSGWNEKLVENAINANDSRRALLALQLLKSYLKELQPIVSSKLQLALGKWRKSFLKIAQKPMQDLVSSFDSTSESKILIIIKELEEALALDSKEVVESSSSLTLDSASCPNTFSQEDRSAKLSTGKRARSPAAH